MDSDLVKQIEELVSDREKFNEFVYTPLEEALSELEMRDQNVSIASYVSESLGTPIPEVLSGDEYAVLSRPVITPNYELRRFLSIVDALKLKPVVWEYTESKFVPQNESKYALGKMGFFFGTGKKGGIKMDFLNVIDINASSGKKINEIKTLWGQSLVDFHHSLFGENIKEVLNAFDGSEWYAQAGKVAKEYYTHFLALFLMNGILFENFMLDPKEIEFTKNIFLPALIKVRKESGHKPLIVALEATTIEGDRFWSCYPGDMISGIKEKLSKI